MPSLLSHLRRVESGVEWIVRGAVIALGAIILLSTLGSASDRYIWDAPFNAYDQIGQLALVWLTFLGFALALRSRTNIRVDVIDAFLTPRGLALRNLCGDLVALAIFGVILWKSPRLVEVGAGQVIMGTPFTSAATFLALAVGSAYGVVVILRRIVLLTTRKDDETC